VLFEVSSLRYATPATVSRCGMVWFGERVVTTAMILSRYIAMLRVRPVRGGADGVGAAGSGAGLSGGAEGAADGILQVQKQCVGEQGV